jgi:hypothetical protein
VNDKRFDITRERIPVILIENLANRIDLNSTYSDTNVPSECRIILLCLRLVAEAESTQGKTKVKSSYCDKAVPPASRRPKCRRYFSSRVTAGLMLESIHRNLLVEMTMRAVFVPTLPVPSALTE